MDFQSVKFHNDLPNGSIIYCSSKATRYFHPRKSPKEANIEYECDWLICSVCKLMSHKLTVVGIPWLTSWPCGISFLMSWIHPVASFLSECTRPVTLPINPTNYKQIIHLQQQNNIKNIFYTFILKVISRIVHLSFNRKVMFFIYWFNFHLVS